MKLSTGLHHNMYESVWMGYLGEMDSPIQTTVPSPERTSTLQILASLIYRWINPDVLGLGPGFIGFLIEFWVVTPRETYRS